MPPELLFGPGELFRSSLLKGKSWRQKGSPISSQQNKQTAGAPGNEPLITKQNASDVGRERSGLRENIELFRAEIAMFVPLLLHPGPLQVRLAFRRPDSYLGELTHVLRLLLNIPNKHCYGLELVLKVK